MIFHTILFLLSFSFGSDAATKKDNVAVEFIILHNNDMHARFEQTNVHSGPCLPEDANTNKCYGGFARVAHEVRKYRAEAENGGQKVIYLNAGDTYSEAPWFTVFKDNISAAFLNVLKPDVISLGNHEFNEGVDGLVPFLNNVEFPVVAANLDLSDAPTLAATKHLTPSTVLDVNGFKIGIVGYLTPETEFLAKLTTVKILPEIDAINKEAAKLKSQGINMIIALGHSGYNKDQEIAKQCPDVDIVIGGHSHSFFYNGDVPSVEKAEGPYPTIVKRSNGVEVPVVQSFAYTKYLGKLHVQFDKDGNLIEFDGNPILLNSEIPRESDVLDLLEVYRPNIDMKEEALVVGHTKVELDGSVYSCRKFECNLGNLISDSMVHARVIEYQGGRFWTDAPIALLNGGGIRSSIEKRPDGSITTQDISIVLPFNDSLLITKVRGSKLRKALEHSASSRERQSGDGFLQMSGIHVVYDYDRQDGSKVIEVEVRCAECDVPSYTPLNDTALYSIVVHDFLYDGGDGYDLKEKDFQPTFLKLNDKSAFEVYLQQREFVYPEVEGRIKIKFS